jgi:hypothetical protein
VREIDGPNCYARLLDEIYYELNKGEEFLVGMADESLSSQEVHAAHSRLVKKGIKFRKLIKEGNTSVHGPLEWYRHIDSIYYQNAASVFYKDKSAYLTENFEKIVIVKDNAIAQANKNFFELAWSHSQLVKQTTADERYE